MKKRLTRHGIAPENAAHAVELALPARRPKIRYFFRKFGKDAKVIRVLWRLPSSIQDWRIISQLLEWRKAKTTNHHDLQSNSDVA